MRQRCRRDVCGRVENWHDVRHHLLACCCEIKATVARVWKCSNVYVILPQCGCSRAGAPTCSVPVMSVMRAKSYGHWANVDSGLRRPLHSFVRRKRGTNFLPARCRHGTDVSIATATLAWLCGCRSNVGRALAGLVSFVTVPAVSLLSQVGVSLHCNTPKPSRLCGLAL